MLPRTISTPHIGFFPARMVFLYLNILDQALYTELLGKSSNYTYLLSFDQYCCGYSAHPAKAGNAAFDIAPNHFMKEGYCNA